MSEYADPSELEGMPAPLPQGERMIWQGKPQWKALAWRTFHLRELTAYFALLSGWVVFSTVWQTGQWKPALFAASLVVTMGLVVAAILGGLAWLSARTTTYTVTSRRIIMQVGMALPVTFNLPFARIASADMKQNRGDAGGDISFQLGEGDQLAYFAIWPHARPWHFKKVQPSFREIADVHAVAKHVAQALAIATGGSAIRVVDTSLAGAKASPALNYPTNDQTIASH